MSSTVSATAPNSPAGSSSGPPGIAIKIGGQTFSFWTRCEIARDLSDIAGSFQFDYDDSVRVSELRPDWNGQALMQALIPGPAVTVAIDGETVLSGNLQDVNVQLEPAGMRASLFGLDRTGDLVDCSSNPNGPAEYLGLDLLGITQRLVQPFGMTARAETDVGDPFPHFSIDVGEPVMGAIEKAARQRGVLVVSDGVGGLVLTEAGTTRAPAPLVMPGAQKAGNIHASQLRITWRERFSDHYIKGQLPHVRTKATKRPVALDGSTAPLGQGAPIAPPPAASTTTSPRKHTAGKGKHGPVYQTGHATDPGVGRYRPKVWITRAEAGLDTVDEQAAWRARTSAAAAQHMTYTVVGHRPGPQTKLWQPNTLVAVTDPVAGLNGVDQLIAGVRFVDGEDGPRTILRVVDPLCYSLDEEAGGPKRAGRTRPHTQHAVDATAKRFR